MSADQTDPEFGRDLRHIGMVVDLLRLSSKSDVDAIAPLLHPQMQMLAAPGVAPSGPYETREDFLAYFAEAQAHGFMVEPDVREIRVTPSGAVLVVGSMRMTSPTGTDEAPAWYVYTFRDGLIASLENHLDRELAYESAGL